MFKMLNYALLLGALAVAGTAQASPKLLAKIKVDKAAVALAEKSRPSKIAHRPVVVRASATYSGTTVDGPVWDRPFATCDGLSASGAGSNYSYQPFTVDAAGDYSVHSEQSFDGFIFVYQGAFDPEDQLTGCIAGNDDDGTNASTIDAVTLATGTNYFVVTTAFSGGDAGTFENTIDGPGNITLGDIPNISLSKTTPGVAVGGNYDYVLTVQNTGETDENITVTDALPAGLTYVSNDCGGTFAAGTFTWALGNVTSGSPAATCHVTVNNPAATCALISNTATATTVSGLTRSSTAANPALQDPSLEASGAGDSDAWASTSTNFGTVLCDANCANDPANAPFEGDWWAWFAGLDPASTTADFPEVGTLTQEAVIPTGATELRFKFRAPVCGGVAADFLSVRVDGTEVFRVDGTSALCGAAAYSDETADITAYADGETHTIEFYSEQTNTGSDTTNFFVDNVTFDVEAACVVTSDEIFADGFDPPTP